MLIATQATFSLASGVVPSHFEKPSEAPTQAAQRCVSSKAAACSMPGWIRIQGLSPL